MRPGRGAAGAHVGEPSWQRGAGHSQHELLHVYLTVLVLGYVSVSDLVWVPGEDTLDNIPVLEAY